MVVEDDAETAAFLQQGLGEEGHSVVVLGDGREALVRALAGDCDLLIVDRMLPGLDGLALVRALRASGIETPVLFLTTLGGIDDRVSGLKAGADDYLVKPYAFAELVARIEALSRRPRKTATETALKVADLEVDLLTRRVRRSGHPIDLQPREYRLLVYLLRHTDQVVTRTMLLENVWDLHFDPQTNVVDSHISRLRGKIDRPPSVPLIHTVRGAGYCLRITTSEPV
jgi:two-component system OmpR family response regulator